MSPELIASIFNSQNVLASLAVVVVVGFGLFIDRRVWPWWVVFSEQWRVDSVNLKNKSLDLQEKNDLRWYRTSDKFIMEMQTSAVVLSTLRAKQEAVLSQVSGLREQIDDMERYFFNEQNEPVTSGDSQ